MENYQKRREQLAKQLEPESIAIVVGAQLQIRNQDTEYPFRQSSRFFYLTGFNEPNAILVLVKDQHGELKSYLFNQIDDPKATIWVGQRIGQQQAVEKYGMDEAYDIADIHQKLPMFFKDKKKIYFVFSESMIFIRQFFNWMKTAKTEVVAKARSLGQTVKGLPEIFEDLEPLVDEMRLIKDEQEIELMRQAAEISANAHAHLMKVIKPGMMEYQISAEFEYFCKKQGCLFTAYPCIVGGGKNSCILHYIDNTQALNKGDVVLIDAGAEYHYYAADITRTMPVNGKFTQEQRALYQLVLKSQLAGIEAAQPGNRWDNIQEVILEVLTEGMVDLGLLKGNVQELINNKAYEKYYMHNSGHWLGLDVHDVGKYRPDGQYRELAPGMVLTVEPGIYWHEKSCGIRIEDDILITKDGPEVLTANAPKAVDDLEALMQ